MASNLVNYQFIRKCTLLVSTKSGKALDLSNLHIRFATKHSDTQTPNTADIRVYNLDIDTASEIKKEFTTVILQAGYEGNAGVIFKGNIKQVILGRESSTDTFIDIVAGDGEQAYNFSIVNTTIKAGAKVQDQLTVAQNAMNKFGVGPGYTSELPAKQLPRGKVFYGSAKDYLRGIADSNGYSWSMQDEKINFVKQSTFIPTTVVVLTSKTGLIGTPQQTNEGVNLKCLINPLIKVGCRIKIDNASVEQLKINQNAVGSPANTPSQLTNDGIYYALTLEYVGDTRGTDWYINIVTLVVNVTSNVLNSVGATYGA